MALLLRAGREVRAHHNQVQVVALLTISARCEMRVQINIPRGRRALRAAEFSLRKCSALAIGVRNHSELAPAAIKGSKARMQVDGLSYVSNNCAAQSLSWQLIALPQRCLLCIRRSVVARVIPLLPVNGHLCKAAEACMSRVMLCHDIWARCLGQMVCKSHISDADFWSY